MQNSADVSRIFELLQEQNRRLDQLENTMESHSQDLQRLQKETILRDPEAPQSQVPIADPNAPPNQDAEQAQRESMPAQEQKHDENQKDKLQVSPLPFSSLHYPFAYVTP